MPRDIGLYLEDMLDTAGYDVVFSAQDIDETTSVLEANLGFKMKFSDGDFIGRKALTTQRDEGLRAAIEARRLVPRSPMLVLSQYVEAQYASELLADWGYTLLARQITRPLTRLGAVGVVLLLFIIGLELQLAKGVGRLDGSRLCNKRCDPLRPRAKRLLVTVSLGGVVGRLP